MSTLFLMLGWFLVVPVMKAGAGRELRELHKREVLRVLREQPAGTLLWAADVHRLGRRSLVGNELWALHVLEREGRAERVTLGTAQLPSPPGRISHLQGWRLTS